MNKLFVLILCFIFTFNTFGNCPFVPTDTRIVNIQSRLELAFEAVKETNAQCANALRSAVNAIRSSDDYDDDVIANRTNQYYELQDINRKILLASPDELPALIESRAEIEKELSSKKALAEFNSVSESRKDAYRALTNLVNASTASACADATNVSDDILSSVLSLTSLASPLITSGEVAYRSAGNLLTGLFDMFASFGSKPGDTAAKNSRMNVYLCLYYQTVSLHCELEGQKKINKDEAIAQLNKLANSFNENDLNLFYELATAQKNYDSVAKSLSDLALARISGSSTSTVGILDEYAKSQSEKSYTDRNKERGIKLKGKRDAVKRACLAISMDPALKARDEEVCEDAVINFFSDFNDIYNDYPEDLGWRNEQTGVTRTVDYVYEFLNNPQLNAIFDREIEKQVTIDNLDPGKQRSNTTTSSVARVIKQDTGRFAILSNTRKAIKNILDSKNTSSKVAEVVKNHNTSLTELLSILDTAEKCISGTDKEVDDVCTGLNSQLGLSSEPSEIDVQKAIEAKIQLHLNTMQTALLDNKDYSTSVNKFLPGPQEKADAPGFERYLAVARSMESASNFSLPDDANIEDVVFSRRQIEESPEIMDIISKGSEAGWHKDDERRKQICALMSFRLPEEPYRKHKIASCRDVKFPDRFVKYNNSNDQCAYYKYMQQELSKDMANCESSSTRFPKTKECSRSVK